jgi:hypothetical protein
MSKRYLGAIALGVGLTFVPVTVRSSDEPTTPTVAVSEACAEGGCCTYSPGDLCLVEDEVRFNYRPSGSSCIKPGT